MAQGFVLGSGGGSALEENTGSKKLPIYIDAEGEAQTIYEKTDAPIYPDTTNDIDINISGNARTADYTITAKNIEWVDRTSTESLYVGGYATIAETDKKMASYNTGVSITTSNVLMGAAWNDYAEFRQCAEKPGTCVVEQGNGILIKSEKRLQKGANIVSDTYGMIIGNNNDQAKAIALCGRVLAKVDTKKFNIGDAVCSGKNGTVSRMNRLEVILFPDRIIGYISEIPTYEKWNNVDIDNRIWIKVV